MSEPAPVRPLSLRAPRLRGLFTLSALVPLGAFLLVHVAINAAAIRGDAAFARAVHAVHRLPALGFVEAVFVFAPLLVHGGIGLFLAIARVPLAETSPHLPPVRAAMRGTGVVVAAFLAMHLTELRFRAPGARLSASEMETLLGADLSAVWHGVPWQGAVYLIGTACVTFHFAAGVWGWLMGTRAGARSRRWTGWLVCAAGAAVWAVLANVVVFHATGSRLFGAPAESAEASKDGPCPAPATR